MHNFIENQRALADAESDSAVAYGMTKVLNALAKVLATASAEPAKSVVSGQWVTPDEACKFYGVEYGTLLQWKKKGGLVVSQPNGKRSRFMVRIPSA